MSLPQMSLSGAAMILVIVVVRALAMDRLPKGTFVALWYMVLARLLLPLSIPSPVSLWSLAAEQVPALETAARAVTELPGGTIHLLDHAGGTVPQVPQAAPAAIPVLPIVWALGGLVFGAVFLSSWLACRWEFQTSLPAEDGFAARWLREHPLRRRVEVRQLTGLATPLTCGVLRPVILMPKDTDWGNRRQVEYMLCHEYVHIRRFDALGKGLVAAALCVHWFNPLVWAMYILFNRDVELACDEQVLRRLGAGERRDYALALIRMEERRAVPAPFVSHFSKNTTEERIVSIMKYKKASVLSVILAVALIVCMTTVFVSAQTDRPAGDTPTPPAGDVQSAVLGGGQPVSDEDSLIRVSGDGFCYYRPAQGWQGDSVAFGSTTTNSEVLIQLEPLSDRASLVDMYQRLGMTKVLEEDGLTVMAQTEILHFMDGSTETCRDEVYIHGQDGKQGAGTVQISWIEESLSANPGVDEVAAMRAMAESFTLTGIQAAQN